MRSVTANDYWRKVYNRNYDHVIEKVNLNGIAGIKEVEFNKGIFAICGLNGAGKSTIISSLKDIFGLKKTKQDLKKINNGYVEANIICKGEKKIISNKDEHKFVEIDENRDRVYYIDYKQATDLLEFLTQENLDELLEQYDDNEFDNELLLDLNYIVGKEYNKVCVIEIEDGESTIPYFRVNIDGLEYDSLSMGIGEHFLFYIFWLLNRIEKSSIILIEEPETFISICSQSKLMNFIAKKASKIGLSIIISTHSPYIIKYIRKENISIVSRYSKYVSVDKPQYNKQSLSSLGLNIPKRGIIFVEDYVAEVFLKIVFSRNCRELLREYNIEYVDGENKITQRLQFPYSNNFTYKIIGIYDGDMKNKIDSKKENINWKYEFLPTNEAVEIEFKRCIRSNIERLCTSLNCEKNILIQSLSKIEGENHHDWLTDFARELGVDVLLLMNKLYDIWYEDKENEKLLQEFVVNIKKTCS